MNQSVLFSDRCDWIEERQQVHFQAQQSGQLIECYVSLSILSSLLGQTVNAEDAINSFEDVRFDIEEAAEQAIEEEAFSPTGEIVLN